MAAALKRKILIPYGHHQGTDDDQVLELEIDDLPAPQECVGILRDQDCKISLWIQVATEYYRQGKFDAFEIILNDCLAIWDQDKVKGSLSTYPDGDKDRIKALDLLAIFYVRRGSKEKNREQRRDYFARAAQKFTEVDKSEFISISKHGSEYQFHLLGRAYCCLIEGRNDQADAQFNFVLQQQQQSNDEVNVPSLLGRACIEFNKKENTGKRVALSFYKKALRDCPQCPADVWLGLAICFYKLNMLEKAEDTFSKALSLDPKCVGALVGLAVIELNKKNKPSLEKGLEHLARAYKIEPSDPMVLTLLADHYFYRTKHAEAIKLAGRALENTENEAMQALACYQLARAFHRQDQYDKAFEYYYKATQFGGSQFVLASYGLGQMYIHRKEYDSAIQAFESVLKACPDNIETLKVLASLYARSNSQSKKEQAKNYLKKVTESNPNDLEAWVELASLIEQHETQHALNAYKTAFKLYEARKETPPPELHNNIAALLFSTNCLDEAGDYYKKALDICSKEIASNEHHFGSILYTIQYNLGRLYESKHQLGEAERIYIQILKQHPMYLDCYLRLGCMERDKGILFNASDKYKETFRVEPDNADAWILIGNLHMSKQEWGPAQRKFERILDNTKQNPDSYSLISVGNVWLQNQYQSIRDEEKLNQQRHRALTFYTAALKFDPKNIYAASGIGCVLAVKGMFNEARDVFSQVREATADFPDVWINIAHIYVEQKQFVAAVQMYENCLKKFYNNANTEILQYIARALFKAKKLLDCKKVLLRARYICPYDMNILFNLAKVLKTLARQVFSDNKSSYNDVVAAEYELKLARTYLKYYQSRMKQDKNAIDANVVNHEEKDCADLILQVETSVKVDAEQREKEEYLRRQEHEEKLAREIARKAEEEKRQAEETRLKKEGQENKRRELLRKQEEERAKQKMLHDDNGLIDDQSEDEDGRSRKKRKKTIKESKQKKDRSERTERDRERGREGKVYKSRATLPSDTSSSDDEQQQPNHPAPYLNNGIEDEESD